MGLTKLYIHTFRLNCIASDISHVVVNVTFRVFKVSILNSYPVVIIIVYFYSAPAVYVVNCPAPKSNSDNTALFWIVWKR